MPDSYVLSHLVDGAVYRGVTTGELTAVRRDSTWWLASHEKFQAGGAPEYRVDAEGWCRFYDTILYQQFTPHVERLMMVRLRPAEELVEYRQRWAEYEARERHRDG